jgi:hypothetical protein
MGRKRKTQKSKISTSISGMKKRVTLRFGSCIMGIFPPFWGVHRLQAQELDLCQPIQTKQAEYSQAP